MVYKERAETASDPCVCVRCKYTTSIDIQKRTIYIYFFFKASHSCRITCERSESARERRITLYKSNHHIYLCINQIVSEYKDVQNTSATVDIHDL